MQFYLYNISAGMPKIPPIVDRGECDRALNPDDKVAVDLCRAEARERGAGPDTSQVSEALLNHGYVVVVRKVAGEERVFARLAQAGGCVQLFAQALDALRYIAHLHLILETLTLLLHLKSLKKVHQCTKVVGKICCCCSL